MLDAGSVNCGFCPPASPERPSALAEASRCRAGIAEWRLRNELSADFGLQNGEYLKVDCGMQNVELEYLQSAICNQNESKIQNLKYRVLMLDQTILMSLEDEARWAMREGLTDKKEIPNYLDFIYVDALEQVKPETVTIIR